MAKAVDADGKKISVLVEREFGGHLVIAAMRIRDERAGPVVGPFYRPAEKLRRMQHADIFGIDRRLHAERAADIAGEDMHLVGFDGEDVGELVLHPEYALALGMQGESLVGGIVFGDRRARLHRRHDQAGVAKRQLRHMGGAGNGRGHLVAVAIMIVERDVARHVVE